jgi:hypothetical protein
MIGPQHLLALRQRDAGEREPSGVARGKRHVARWMPVLRQEEMPKTVGQVVDGRDDRIGIGNRQAASGAEVILHIDDHESRIHVRECHRQRLAVPQL